MSALSDRLFDLLLAVIRSGGYALVAALVAETLVLLLGPLRVRKRIGYVLLLVVLVRMAIPAGVASPFSLFNLSFVKEPLDDRCDLPADGGPVGEYDIAIQGSEEYDDTLYAGLTPVKDDGLSFSYIRYTTDAAGAILPAQTYREKYGAVTAWIWFGGVLLFWGYGIVTTVLLKRRVSTATRVAPGVYESDRITSPFILGIFRPVIYLPLGLTPEQRELVLCHERMHLRWGDHIVKLLAYFITGLYWMTVWLGFYFYRLLLYAMEEACDQDALRQLGEGRKADYGEALLAFSTKRQFRQVMTVAFSESWVKDRIRQVLKYKPPRRWLSVPAALLALAVAISLSTDALPAEASSVDAPAAHTLYDLLPEGFLLSSEMEISAEGQALSPDADACRALRSRLYALSFVEITELGQTTVTDEGLPVLRLRSRDGDTVELTLSETALVLYDPAQGVCRRAGADRVSLAAVRGLIYHLLGIPQDTQSLYQLPQSEGASALGWTLSAADGSKDIWLYTDDSCTEYLLLWNGLSFQLPLWSADEPFFLQQLDLNGDGAEELVVLCDTEDGQRLYVCTPTDAYDWQTALLTQSDLSYYLDLDFAEWADAPDRLDLMTLRDNTVWLTLDHAAPEWSGVLLSESNDTRVDIWQDAVFGLEDACLTVSASRMLFVRQDGDVRAVPVARVSARIAYNGEQEDHPPFEATIFRVTPLDIP